MTRPRIIRLVGRWLIKIGFWLDPFEPGLAPTRATIPSDDPKLETIGRYRSELIAHTANGRYLAAIDVAELLLPLLGPNEAEAMVDTLIPNLRSRAAPERRGMIHAVR